MTKGCTLDEELEIIKEQSQPVIASRERTSSFFGGRMLNWPRSRPKLPNSKLDLQSWSRGETR